MACNERPYYVIWSSGSMGKEQSAELWQCCCDYLLSHHLGTQYIIAHDRYCKQHKLLWRPGLWPTHQTSHTCSRDFCTIMTEVMEESTVITYYRISGCSTPLVMHISIQVALFQLHTFTASFLPNYRSVWIYQAGLQLIQYYVTYKSFPLLVCVWPFQATFN